jgi:hypothetical protein
MDDLFLVHEHAGSLLGISWGEHLIYAGLAISLGLYLILFRHFIAQTPSWVLFIGIGGLGASVIVDVFQPWLTDLGELRNILEDGLKWLGIVGWATYHWISVRSTLTNTKPLRHSAEGPVNLLGTSSPSQITIAVVALCMGLLVIALMVFAGNARGVGIPYMTRDVASIAQVSPLTGMLSNLGILLWCATATSGALVASVLSSMGKRQLSLMFLGSGILSAYLMLDDLFLIHEDLAFRYFGIRERYVLIFLGAGSLAWLIGSRRSIMKSPYVHLLTALGLLALSIVVDGLLARMFPSLIQVQAIQLVEDGLKWLGIVAWSTYHISHGMEQLANLPEDSPAPTQ